MTARPVLQLSQILVGMMPVLPVSLSKSKIALSGNARGNYDLLRRKKVKRSPLLEKWGRKLPSEPRPPSAFCNNFNDKDRIFPPLYPRRLAESEAFECIKTFDRSCEVLNESYDRSDLDIHHRRIALSGPSRVTSAYRSKRHPGAVEESHLTVHHSSRLYFSSWRTISSPVTAFTSPAKMVSRHQLFSTSRKR